MESMPTPPNQSEPGIVRWGVSVAASAGLTGMLCCVAPMVLFMTGLMGGAYAISFADFFYAEDGTAGTGAWVLRGIAVAVGAVGAWRYNQQQHQCSMEPQRRTTNLVLVAGIIAILGTGVYLTLESLSSWYFDAYIVPAQQRELGLS